jgi:hypothetical protein
MAAKRRLRVEHTEDWDQLELLLDWPEQVEYERIRPPVVFGSPVAERSRQTGTPETTLRRRIASFENEGMRGLFEPERVEGTSTLPPEVRRLILDLKAEHPPMRDNEIATVCYVRFGRRPHGRTVRRVLEANPTAMRMFRRFRPYHEIPDAVEETSPENARRIAGATPAENLAMFVARWPPCMGTAPPGGAQGVWAYGAHNLLA